MPKCLICKDNQATWSWQPFGPGETANLFTTPGSHYRGFATIKVCDACKNRFQRGDEVGLVFRFRYVLYRAQYGVVDRYDSPKWAEIEKKYAEKYRAPYGVVVGWPDPPMTKGDNNDDRL